MENKEYTVIRTYNKAWKIELKFYSLWGLKLPFAIVPKELAYFFAGALIIFVSSQIFTPLKYVPSILRYAVAPFGLTWFLRNKKLNGKNPIRFFGKLFVYLLTKNLITERFTAKSPANGKFKIDWWCSYVDSPGFSD